VVGILPDDKIYCQQKNVGQLQKKRLNDSIRPQSKTLLTSHGRDVRKVAEL